MAEQRFAAAGTALQNNPGKAAGRTYDLAAAPAPLSGGEYGAVPAPRGGTRLRSAEHPAEQAADKPAAAQLFAPLTFLGVLAAVFLLVSGIAARITLIQLSEEGLAMEARLEELQQEQTRLRIAYESAFNLGRVETYARDVLGMRKPTADQITYIDTSAPDRAQVFAEEPRDGFVDRVSDMLAGFREYFGLTGE